MARAASGVLSRARDLLSEVLVLDRAEVREQSRLMDDLNVDSIALIEIWTVLQAEFQIDVPELHADEQTLSLPLPAALHRLAVDQSELTLAGFLERRAVEATMAVRGPIRDEESRLGLLNGLTIREFASAIDGAVPQGVAPDAPIATLHLRDLFRFVTVGAMADYVEHLVSNAAS